MRKVRLLKAQAVVLKRIAQRSKMDSWFKIDDSMEVSEKDINDLMDCATPYDLKILSEYDVYTLVGLLIKCNAIKK